jgi:hypothetical protein
MNSDDVDNLKEKQDLRDVDSLVPLTSTASTMECLECVRVVPKRMSSPFFGENFTRTDLKLSLMWSTHIQPYSFDEVHKLIPMWQMEKPEPRPAIMFKKRITKDRRRGNDN